MKGSIILFGECFRSGGQHSRTRDKNESFEEQILASKRQVDFFNYLRVNKGIHIDIYIASYKTKFLPELNSVYNDFLVDSIWLDNPIGINNLIKKGYNLIENKGTCYEFILCMRIDIYLRETFFQVFDPFWSTIRFAFIEDTLSLCDIIRVNDIIVFFPNKYFNILKEQFIHHIMLYDLLINEKLGIEDFDVMINTFHLANSSEAYNPLYYIVNRKESQKRYKNNNIYDKYKTFADRGIYIVPQKNILKTRYILNNYYNLKNNVIVMLYK